MGNNSSRSRQRDEAIREIASDLRASNERNEQMWQELETQSRERQRLMMVHSIVSKKYVESERKVKRLTKENQVLRSRVERSDGRSLLDQVRNAIDSDPIFEDEIRAIIEETPRIKRDYERHVLSYPGGPSQFDNEPGPSRAEAYSYGVVESDGPGQIESDAVTESDDNEDYGFHESAEPIFEDEDLESSVAIAYVLSKMYNKQ